jgi:hypothetical protein
MPDPGDVFQNDDAGGAEQPSFSDQEEDSAFEHDVHPGEGAISPGETVDGTGGIDAVEQPDAAGEFVDLAALAPQIEAYAHGEEEGSWTAVLFEGDIADALSPYEPPDPVDVQTFIEHMLAHLGLDAD